MKLYLILFLTILSFNNFNVNFQQSTPNPNVAIKFLNSYVEYLNNQLTSDVNLDIQEWVNDQPTVTNNFKVELQRIIKSSKNKDPEYGLGFDPILAAQDFPENGFELGEIDTRTTFLTLTGINWNEFKVRMKLKWENGKWLVDGSGIVNIPKEEQIGK